MRTLLIWVFIILIASYLAIKVTENSLNIKETTYYEVWKQLKQNNVKKAELKDNEITIELYKPYDIKYYKIKELEKLFFNYDERN